MTTYRSKPTEVEAERWGDGTGTGWDMTAAEIVAWVNTHGGEARYEPDTTDSYLPGHQNARLRHPARIAVRTINGWAYAAPGHYVVMGSATFEPRDRPLDTRELLDFYPVATLADVRVKHEWEPVSS